MTNEDFVKRLAGGTTCNPFVELIEEYRGYLIFHHKSHPAYLNRFDGSVTCEAYLAYIKFNPDFDNIRWTTLFLQEKHRFHVRKSKNGIVAVKTLIDGEIIENY